MPVMCEMHALHADAAARLEQDPGSLPEVLAASDRYSDVYKYWHAIEFLLGRVREGQPLPAFLTGGRALTEPDGETPSTRLLSAAETAELAQAVSGIEPEALIPHWDPEALDAAGVYARDWVELEEENDMLGQVLEHYSYLQSLARDAAARHSVLFHFRETDW